MLYGCQEQPEKPALSQIRMWVTPLPPASSVAESVNVGVATLAETAPTLLAAAARETLPVGAFTSRMIVSVTLPGTTAPFSSRYLTYTVGEMRYVP